MDTARPNEISHFFLAGVNYKKSDAHARGQFAISKEQYTRLLESAPQFGVKEFFVLSTCNRTEIYGFAENVKTLSALLCSETTGTLSLFEEMAYTAGGEAAIRHLFEVAAGLDSQILGDYEIIGQLKQAIKFAKEKGFVGAYLERMFNGMLQSSKEIKNTTVLSGGTVSVSFAAVQYIREHVHGVGDKKILLIGTGKIGRNTCKNLVNYLGTRNITLVNRTEDKARELALSMGLHYAPVQELRQHIESSDVILVATNSTAPLILKSHVLNKGRKLVIDLSIPYNVEPDVHHLPHVSVVNVDALSRIKDETLHKRQAEVPKARVIIEKHVGEFMEWHDMRRYVPVLKAVKSRLETLDSCNLYTSYLNRNISVQPSNKNGTIQKVINGMAVKMRQNNPQGCCYLEAINEYIATGTI